MRGEEGCWVRVSSIDEGVNESGTMRGPLTKDSSSERGREGATSTEIRRDILVELARISVEACSYGSIWSGDMSEGWVLT